MLRDSLYKTTTAFLLTSKSFIFTITSIIIIVINAISIVTGIVNSDYYSQSFHFYLNYFYIHIFINIIAAMSLNIFIIITKFTFNFIEMHHE